MRRWTQDLLIIPIAAFGLLDAVIFLPAHGREVVHAATRVLLTATPTPSAGNSSGNWPDSTIIAAFIGVAGILLSATVAIVVAIRSEGLQRSLVRFQREVEQEYTF